MNTHSTSPRALQRIPHHIVGATPLRPSGQLVFHARDARTALTAPTHAQSRRPLHHAYLRPAALPAFFHIHS